MGGCPIDKMSLMIEIKLAARGVMSGAEARRQMELSTSLADE